MMFYEIAAIKASAALAKVCVAKRMNSKIKLLGATREHVVLHRLMARQAANEYSNALEAVRDAHRAMKKAGESGITFAIGESYVQKLKEECELKKQALVEEGYLASGALDMWQEAGATLKDLCNLCNRDYEQVLEEVSVDRRDEPFSSIVWVHNLDFKSDLDFLTFDVDAPLTHAIKESVLDTMLNTPKGQAASRSAMNACFPEIMENALQLYTDGDGVRRLIDKDGVEVGALDDE